jgi:translation initiation factor 1A
MPPKKGGKKGKKGKKTNIDKEVERALVYKNVEELQEYAQVTKLLGNCRCDVLCVDGINRLAHIRGNMRKKVWIKSGDIVLVSLREYEDAKADIIYLYTTKEAKNLKIYGELPETFKINENIDITSKEENDDLGVDFREEDDEESDKEVIKDFEEEFKFI